MPDLSESLSPLIDRVRTDVTAKFIDGKMMWAKDEPLTKARIKEHVFSNLARGVCPIKAGENVTRCALLDLDSHKGETPWEEMLNVAELVIEAFSNRGLKITPFRSRGGKGIHLIMIWDDPQDAYSVRSYLSLILSELGYKNGTKGVARKEIEIFPKQDSVPSDGFGNQFILPLAGKSVPLFLWADGSLSLSAREEAANIKWPMSDPVPITKPKENLRPERSASQNTPSDLARISDALRFIKADDYDDWVKVGMALYHETGGSYEGLMLWDKWSAGDVI